MARKIFHVAKSRTILANQCTGLVSQNPLVSASLQKLAHPKTSRVTRIFVGGQGVVCTNDLVTEAHVGPWAKKQRAVIGHVLEEIVWIARDDLHMLEGQLVGFEQHLFLCVANNHFTVVGPARSGNACGRQDRQLAFDFSHGFLRQLFTGCQQDGR